MVKKLFTLLLTVAMAAATQHALAATTAAAPADLATNDGSTAAKAIRINNLANLKWLSETSAHWSKYIIQTANIDARDTRTWNSGAGFVPIGNASTNFTGKYNGKGHTISHLYINKTTIYAGLFGYVFGAAARVDSVYVVNANVRGGQYTAVLVGWLYSNATVNHCYVTGNVSGSGTDLGGLIGSLEISTNGLNSTVTNCYVMCTVVAINNSSYVGGLAGHGRGTITNSYSVGKVSTSSSNSGGLTGPTNTSTLPTVTSSYYDSIVAKRKDTGRGAPKSTTQMKQQSTFVNWNFTTAPIIWAIQENKTYPYFSEQSAPVVLVSRDANALVFELLNTADSVVVYKTSNKYVTNVMTLTASTTPSSLTTGNKTINVSLADTLCIVSYEHNKVPSYPVQSMGVVIPIPPALFCGGSGTAAAPYQICNFEQLKFLSENSQYWDKHFVQTADIDAGATKNAAYGSGGGVGFNPIGNATVKFTGSYNGKRHIVANLYINRDNTDDVGMFGYANGAVIDSIGIINANYTGHYRVGALVGHIEGAGSKVSNSYATGAASVIRGANVAGHNNAHRGDDVGGLIGFNWGAVTNCYSTVAVLGKDWVGGLVGSNSGAINSGYSTGKVSASGSNVGGLTFINTNDGGSVANSYYDRPTSGQSDNDGKGTPKTTAEMWKQTTYLPAGTSGWNFTVNPITWKIRNDSSYAYFPWQSAPVYVQEHYSNSLKINLLRAADSVIIYNKTQKTTRKLTAVAAGNNTVASFTAAPTDTLYITTYRAGLAPSYSVQSTQMPPDTITVTPNTISKVYGTPDPAITYTMTDQPGSHSTAGITGTLGRKAGDNVGTYPLTVGSTGWTLADHVFRFDTAGVRFTITKARRAFKDSTVSVTYSAGLTLGGIALTNHYQWLTAATALTAADSGKSYPARYIDPVGNYYDTTGTIQVNISKAVGGWEDTTITVVYSPGLTLSALLRAGSSYAWHNPATVLNAGTGQLFAATYTHPSGNSTAVSSNITVNVLPSAGTGSVALAGWVYGSPDTPTVIATTNTGAAVTYTYAGRGSTSYGSTAAQPKNVGTYTLTAVFAATANYNAVTFSVNFEITKAPLTVTVKDTSKVYGGANPATFEVTYSGLQYGETDPALSLAHTFNCAATPASPVGTVPINISGGASANYSFAHNNGTLSIVPDTITITARDTSKFYRQGEPAIPYTVSDGNQHDVSAAVAGAYFDRAAGEHLGSYNILPGGGWTTIPNHVLRFDTAGVQFHIVLDTVLPGEGSAHNPFVIATLSDLAYLSAHSEYWDLHFIQINDIDAGPTRAWDGGSGFAPIGNSGIPFGGTYNGQGHSISNLYIHRAQDDNIGLFGYVSSTLPDTARVDSLGLLGADIAGQNNVGALVGYNSGGTLSNTYAAGSVSGTDTAVGGLVGHNRHEGTVANSYAMVSVQGGTNIGGLVGHNDSAAFVANSYAVGSVNGSSNFGGLAGSNTGTVSNSYYNRQIAGAQGNNGVGTGLTTAQMWTRDTFALSAWSLDTLWTIRNAESYPYFTWQSAPVYVNGFTSNLLEINLLNSVDSIVLYHKNTNNRFQNLGAMQAGDTSIALAGLAKTDTIYIVTYEAGKSSSYPLRAVTLYSGGNGTTARPFVIKTLADLRYLSEHPEHWSAPNNHFIQVADIDADSTQDWNSGAGFSPIGANSTVPFMGTYNGKGHTISHLHISRSGQNFVGLFGYLSAEGNDTTRVDSVGLVNVNITGNDGVGGLVGFYDNSRVVISHSYTTGAVTGVYSVGGLVGDSERGKISNCYSSSTVLGRTLGTGGLVGYSLHSQIDHSYSSGRVSGNTDVGGLVGWNQGNSVISNSYSMSAVLGTMNNLNGGIGGLVGNNSASIINSYSTGAVLSAVSGTDNTAGGLVGKNTGDVAHSYYDSITAGQKDLGKGSPHTTAEMWQNNNNITYLNWGFDDIWTIRPDSSYAYFEWQSAPVYVNGRIPNLLNINILNPVDSVVAYNKNNARVGFLEAQTSGGNQKIQLSGIGLSDTVYLVAYEAGKSPSYPVMGIAETVFSGGEGSPDNPFVIATLEDLDYLSQHEETWHSYFIQVADIDAGDTRHWNNGEGFAPIGSSSTPFGGVYNGGGYTISNLYIDRPGQDNVGLFGYADSAKIDSLGLKDAYISGQNNVGGLVGNAVSSEIGTCYVSGEVSGLDNVGGLAGISQNTTVFNSYSAASIAGRNNVGGIVGHNDGATVSNAYSTGAVQGKNNVGGAIGYNSNNGKLEYIYAAGKVSGASGIGGLVGTNNGAGSPLGSGYYDTQTVDLQVNNGIGTPKSTAEMRQEATFAGWNFGTIWKIDENMNYPYLAWQPAIHTAAITDTAGPKHYTGNAHTPQPVVVWGNDTLVLNKDYTLTYSDNVNVGNAAVIIIGKGIYGGAAVHIFEIVQDIADTITVTAHDTSKVYDNNAQNNPPIPYTAHNQRGEDVTALLSGVLSRVAGENAGVYNITQGSGWAWGNSVFVIDTGKAKFTIHKAVPLVTFPTADSVAYHHAQTLADVPLLGGAALGVDGNSVEGTFEWTQPAVVPTPAAGAYSVTFAPGGNDSINYTTVVQMVDLVVFGDTMLLFDDYAVAKFTTNTFFVNLRKLREEGIEPYHCRWYQNGQQIGEGFVYSAGDSSIHKLSSRVAYTFVVESKNKHHYYSTEKILEPHQVAGGEEGQGAQLFIYPNPATDRLTITSDLLDTESLIEIYDINGKLAASHRVRPQGNSITITITNLPPGSYIVKVGNATAKMVKK
ncbi:hypothetical protein FACS1894156_5120 [Bacteroidia bacterium]|nr:hypothetical protein FACS1894156_5120 [Bacteroidia bacterium]